MVWDGHGEQIHIAEKEVSACFRVAVTRSQFKLDPEYTFFLKQAII